MADPRGVVATIIAVIAVTEAIAHPTGETLIVAVQVALKVMVMDLVGSTMTEEVVVGITQGAVVEIGTSVRAMGDHLIITMDQVGDTAIVEGPKREGPATIMTTIATHETIDALLPSPETERVELLQCPFLTKQIKDFLFDC